MPHARSRGQEYHLQLRDKATGAIEPLRFDKAELQPAQPVPASRELL